jgi:ubiquinol-cytochrome c reductase cytochrome c1 subunit
MVRPLGILAGLGFVTVLLWSLMWGVIAYVSEPPKPTVEHEFHLHPKEVSYSFAGPAGTYDRAQLQRGYQVFKEVCSACHSLKYVAFRDLEQIGFSKAEVKAIAKGWTVPSIDPATGEPATRPGIASDNFPLVYANDTAARAAQNNAIPPDLSLMAKAREGGPAYIYSLLSGYADPLTYKNKDGKLLPKENRPSDTTHFNPYFANLNLAMAPPLTDGQVSYADGSKNGVKNMAKDVSAFLMWAAEPKLEARNQTGWAALIFLLIGTAIAWLAYQSIWADKKPKKGKLIEVPAE